MVLGVSERTFRRWRDRHEALYDRHPGPGLGAARRRWRGNPLQRSRPSTAEKLVADHGFRSGCVR